MPSISKEKQKEYDEKRAGTRGRNFSFIVYPDDLPENWAEILDETRIRWIESPLHDKDVFTEEDEKRNPEHKAGCFKKAHKHCMAMFDSVKTVKQVVEFFKTLYGASESGSVIGVLTPVLTADRSGTVRYMAHLDSPTKAQYDVADITGHNGADPNEIMKFSLSETLHKMIEIEKYIEENNITELCELSARIRETHIDWYQIVTTKNTVYFNAFIRSRRHKARAMQEMKQALNEDSVFVDADGEIRWRKK